MKTDAELQEDIKAELQWDSRLHDSSIHVTAARGHVTLSGSAFTLLKKLHAEDAARRVAGVKSVTNEIEVVVPGEFRRTDKQIEEAVLNALHWNSGIDESKVLVNVNNGFITLQGTVDWEYQRAKARHVAEEITGVKGVTNLIKVAPSVEGHGQVREGIQAAIKRNFYLNPEKIKVEVEGSNVTLTGEVRTLLEKKAAERVAWSAPGIAHVVNNLEVHRSKVFVPTGDE
jgi:osmotically-inducible protein OsmY